MNKPRVTVNPLEKYELVEDVRIHNEYTPATAPVSNTLSVIITDEKNTDVTLVTTLAGVPEQELDAITNADESLDTFTNPAPLITVVCPNPLNTGITVGVNEVKETMLKIPASTYGETLLHRTHN